MVFFNMAIRTIFGMPRIDFIIFRQSALARDPRERSSDNPSFGQHGEGVPNFRGDMHQPDQVWSGGLGNPSAHPWRGSE